MKPSRLTALTESSRCPIALWCCEQYLDCASKRKVSSFYEQDQKNEEDKHSPVMGNLLQCPAGLEASLQMQIPAAILIRHSFSTVVLLI